MEVLLLLYLSYYAATMDKTEVRKVTTNAGNPNSCTSVATCWTVDNAFSRKRNRKIYTTVTKKQPTNQEIRKKQAQN